MSRLKSYCFLHLTLLIYSISSLLSKIASKKDFLSKEFLIYYIVIIGVLLIYAILWQQVLKNMLLTVAFANKSITIVWGMLWGNLLFNEEVTINMIIGVIIIFVGVYYLVVNENV